MPDWDDVVEVWDYIKKPVLFIVVTLFLVIMTFDTPFREGVTRAIFSWLALCIVGGGLLFKLLQSLGIFKFHR